MDTINYTYVSPESEVLNVVAGLTYLCPHCSQVNLIHSREEVYGTLVQQAPDRNRLDLIFGHECTHCKTEVTMGHYLPFTFRVWQEMEEEDE